jgi:hypothetical protein
MNWAQKRKFISLVVSLILTGCTSAPDLPTPQMIGEKERLRVISGTRAARVVNRMHGQSVATDANVIAEYGQGDQKDVLYISRYAEPGAAEKAYALTLEKMAAAKKGPFQHLMPMEKYHKKAYMALGMGAMHYIYQSGSSLLWFQTYQSFGTALPKQLLALYPI